MNAAERKFIADTRNVYLAGRIYKGQIVNPMQNDYANGLNYFVEPDMVVYPSDFSELVNFREINDNILPGVRFSGRNGQYSTSVFNRATDYGSKIMWFAERGSFSDLAYIATLGTGNIRRVEVFNRSIFLGA
jgi:hypothetical protein